MQLAKDDSFGCLTLTIYSTDKRLLLISSNNEAALLAVEASSFEDHFHFHFIHLFKWTKIYTQVFTKGFSFLFLSRWILIPTFI